MTKEQKKARRALLDLLHKLEIRSADPSILRPWHFEELMENVMDNFGQPDQLIMDFNAGSALMALLENVAKQEKANEKVVSDILGVASASGSGNKLPDSSS